jgi:pimeloyl-ACP methyl ester carboxylesterase
MDELPRWTIDVPQDRVDDMFNRVRAAHIEADYDNSDWRFGVERDWMKQMVQYWASAYDWREAEKHLNAMPNHRVQIDGLPIHFVRLRGQGDHPLAVLLTHGWPWTYLDWSSVAEWILTQDPPSPWDCFDVVVPSLPGFIFSEPLRQTNVDLDRIARIWTTLMTDVLNYGTFVAVGGDWGAMVTGTLARQGPRELAGAVLLTATFPGIIRHEIPAEAWSLNETWMPQRMSDRANTILSHVAVGRHSPQTLGYALADSPVGAAAWVWAPRHDWTQCGSDPTTVFGADFLCTTASLYWLTRTVGTSMRLYATNAASSDRRSSQHPQRHGGLGVPVAVVMSPYDVVFTPRSVMSREFNVRRWTVLPRGGHFAPAENPTLVGREIVDFVADTLGA